MRYLLIVLMIVLLPVRGWAGNAMAVDMAAQQMAVQQILVAQTSSTSRVSTDAITAGSAMPDDCPMHLQAVNVQAVDDKPGQADTNVAHCHSCDTCELCLALGSWSHTAWVAGTTSRPASLQLTAHDFRSADAAASFKPPIS